MKKIGNHKRQLLFSSKDLQQIRRLGQHFNAVNKQLELYRQGPVFLRLNRPCRIHDGILSIPPARKNELVAFYENHAGKSRLMKFVPASGAASRMFAEWFSLLDSEALNKPECGRSFMKKLKKYPFYFLIEQDKKASKFIRQNNIRDLLAYILSAGGLKYGWLPKALIPFHFYKEDDIRTAMEEHLYEAADYVRGAGNICRLHFTVSREHQNEIVEKIRIVKSECQKHHPVRFSITYSFQSAATNVLAVDEKGLPFRDDTGALVFRPGGHGTLLGNLNKLNADLIFIRNIDNIAPQTRWKKMVPFHKMMGGLAMQIQEEIFANIRRLKAKRISAANIEKARLFCSGTLNIRLTENFNRQSRNDKITALFSVLNRPLRVCGVVRNNNEPGGGPFWVEEDDGTLTMQIVESAHVDQRKNDQLKIWSKAQYFNPVDMVCCIKDYRGKPFNLNHFVNRNSYIISSKKEKGRAIRALEMPGLWNGSMAYWNTVFVKIPLMVFNPVKSVDDLLRPVHLNT